MSEDMLKRESELESPNQDELSLASDGIAEEIRLTNGRCLELPESPNYPFLVKLFLQDNTNLTDIPPSFFEHMPNLEVLDLSNTSVSALPWSVSKLLKLKELLLKRCEMLTELPPEIGSLTNLRVLDLEETELICLPEQIGYLLRLEYLKFSLYKYADHHKEGSVISRDTLSKLSCLKELSIQVDPECEWWDAEVEAIIDDLGKLGNLETLKLYLPTNQLFEKILELKRLERDGMPLLFPSLSNFQLIVGRHEDPIMPCVPRVLQEEFMKLDKCLKYVNLGDYLDVEVLEHVRALFIHRPWSSSQALSELDLTRMNNLTFCLLAEWDSMRTIIDGHQLEYRIGNCILGSVYYLGIHYMKNLLSIWKGWYSRSCLSNLKILSIHSCPKLTSIFYYGSIGGLVLLEELVIKDCIVLKSLLERGLVPRNVLPKLRKISLLHLPELEKISSGQFIAPNLETMVIYNCPKLENLYPLEKCSKNVKVIKGESKWWESKKSGWSKEQHDYLAIVFVPLKVDDFEDDDEVDELAEAVHISLKSMSQAIEREEDLIANLYGQMKDNRAEEVELPFQQPQGPSAVEGGSSGGGADEGERNSANVWPRQETIILLKIRSDMDALFKDSIFKGPLWEDVSRKLAELGFHRSAKKCKEKFENVYKYHRRTKDVQALTSTYSSSSKTETSRWNPVKVAEPFSVGSDAYSAEPERRTGSNYGSSSITLARLKEPSNFEFTMSEIKKATGNFSPSLKIGQGGFAEVYKAQLEDGTLVVVKRDRKALYDEHLGVEFQSEIRNLTNIEHNNLVKYYGYSEHEEERVLVLEFVPNGTLREHLDCLHGKVLDFGARLNIGIDVAMALNYLHMCTNPHIVHGNIKSSNVLLTHTLSAKVADFGFPKLKDNKESILRQLYATDDLDPDYFLKSDVCSFGDLLVELVTGRRPIEAERVYEERVTSDWVRRKFYECNALMTLDPKLDKSAANETAIVNVLKLSLQCLDPDPNNRPNIISCAHTLHEIRYEYRNPSKRHE